MAIPNISLAHILILASAGALLLSRSIEASFTSILLRVLPFALSLYTVYVSYLYPFYVSPLRYVPTVPGFPLWGNFLEIVTTEVGVPQRRWHKQYGPIIRYFFPFGAERLAIADDEALKHMTVKNPYNYPKPVRAKLWMERILGGEGILLAEGDAHVRQRKALTPGFSIGSIRGLAPVFWTKGFLLTDLWNRTFSSSGATTLAIEVLDWLNRTPLDIIGQAAFGSEINSLEQPSAPLRQAYTKVFAFDFMSRALHGIQAFIPMSKHIPSKMNRDMQSARETIANIASRIVHSKQDCEDSKEMDIMALIVRDNEKLKQSHISSEQLSFETMRDQVMTFLGAGHDTTATGIAWTLHLLAENPEIQERLRAEIKQFYPLLFDYEQRAESVDGFSDQDVDKLHYLNNVCRESLRYIPPIPMTVRQNKEIDKLGGYTIPAGSTIYILANAINRLPQYWGETADDFNPDRWDNLPSTFTPNAYMTFLQGPRSCIGKKFAEMEMKILLCCLLSVYKFSSRPDTNNPEDWKMWRLVLRPKEGISLNVSLLNSNKVVE